jgi:ribosome-binding protein aMBF1 (putative translation factor)
MVKKKTRAQIFMEEQLQNQEVAQSFHEGLEEMRLSVKIAQLREERGLTQTQLAAIMHTSTPVISRLENKGRCTISTLKKVADALNVALKIDLVPRKELKRA